MPISSIFPIYRFNCLIFRFAFAFTVGSWLFQASPSTLHNFIFWQKNGRAKSEIKIRETTSVALAARSRTRVDNPQRDNVNPKRVSLDGRPWSRIVPPIRQSRKCVPLSNLTNQESAQSKHGLPHSQVKAFSNFCPNRFSWFWHLYLENARVLGFLGVFILILLGSLLLKISVWNCKKMITFS